MIESKTVEEREYAISYYFCQLKAEAELKDYSCKDSDGFPDCRTCDYQIKTNAEIQKNYDEVMEWNREHGIFPRARISI